MKIEKKELLFKILMVFFILGLVFASCTPTGRIPSEEPSSSAPETEKPLDLTPESSPKDSKTSLELNVVSYNLSWATQKNIKAGTEINFVKACQKKSLNSFPIQQDSISYCTRNAADGLLNYINQNNSIDIIAVQEGTEYTENWVDYLNKSLGSEYFRFIESEVGSTAILFMLYREDVLGVGQELLRGQFSEGRPYQVVYFPDSEILAVNAHFPHNLSKENYKAYISDLEIKIKNNLFNWKKLKRVLFMGDFNDHSKSFAYRSDKNFYFLDHDLKMKGKAPKTCCWKSYSLTSDYIFDSEKQKSFGVVPGMTTKKTNVLMSDHDPVLSTSYKKDSLIPRQNSEENEDSIGFDFDGVLHLSVSRPDSVGQVHPDFSLDYNQLKVNRDIIKVLKKSIMQGKDVYIRLSAKLS